VNIYGSVSDGRLTFSQINATAQYRTKVLTGPNLGFAPKTLTTLNYNTVLATTTGGALYRVDVITNNTSLNFTKTLISPSGWTHAHLTYDGTYLYGNVATSGELLRYTLTVNGNGTKPTAANITTRTVIGASGFGTLKSLTSTAPKTLLANTTIGQLVSYKANGANSYTRHSLSPASWSGMRNLLSAGSGIFYGHNSTALYAYRDANPTDGSGTDISASKTIDTGGWTQTKLSAQHNTVTCPASGAVTYAQLVTMFGARVGSRATVEVGLPSLNAAMTAGNITTPARKSAFLATLVNESRIEYSALQPGTSTYRGRGFIQLTNNFNYDSAGRYFGVNLLGQPELARSLAHSANISRWYWTVERTYTNSAADKWDMGLVSQAIGYARSSTEDLERCNDFKSAMKFYTGVRPADSAVKCYRPTSALVGGRTVDTDDYLRDDPRASGKVVQRTASERSTTR